MTALKRAKVTSLEEEKSVIQLSKDTLNNIKSFFNSFRSLLEKVTDTKFNIASTDVFSQNIANSSNLEILTANANAGAMEGKYDIKVNKLASNTTAGSNYISNIETTETITATNNTLLKDLGIKTGRFQIKDSAIPNITTSFTIDNGETIGSLTQKLNAQGISAALNSDGIYSIDIDLDNLIENINLIQGLKLKASTPGYSTVSKLTYLKQEVVSTLADSNTLLTDLGVSSGRIEITDSTGNEYLLDLEQNDTLGDLINALKQEGINASINNGIFAINGANITNDTTTNLISALGLTKHTNNIYSNEISYKTIVPYYYTATKNTLLNDLNTDIKVKNGDTVILKDPGNAYRTITLSSTETIESLRQKIVVHADAANFNSSTGQMTISGAEIVGGTYDIKTAFNMEVQDTRSWRITGTKQLTTTVTVYNSKLTQYNSPNIYATLDTKLSDLGVTDFSLVAGINKSTNNRNWKEYKIFLDKNATLGDLLDSVEDKYGARAYSTYEDGTIKLRSGVYLYGGAAEQLGFNKDNMTFSSLKGYSHMDAESSSQSLFRVGDAGNYMDRARDMGDYVLMSQPKPSSYTMPSMGTSGKLILRRNTDNTTGSTQATITINTTTTYNSLNNQLAAYNLKISCNNGIFRIESTGESESDGYYIYSDSSSFLANININISSLKYSRYNTVTKSGTSASNNLQTGSFLGDLNTTLAELGFTATGTRQIKCIQSDHKIKTVTVTGTMTLSEFFNETGINYMYYERGAFELSGLENIIYDNSSKYVLDIFANGITLNSTSRTIYASESTYLSDFGGQGFEGTLEIFENLINSSGGELYDAFTFSEQATIGTIISALKNCGYDAKIENGRIIIDSKYSNFQLKGTAASLLGIGAVSNTLGRITTTSTPLQEIDEVLEDVYLNNDTKLSEIGITSGEFVLSREGRTDTLTVTNTMTIANLRNLLAYNGLDSYLSNKGVFRVETIDGVDFAFLRKGSGSNIIDILFKNKSNTYQSNSLQFEQIKQVNSEIDEETPVCIFGSAGQGSLNFNINSETKSISISGNDTFGDLISKLGEIGLHGFIKDGKFNITAYGKDFSINGGTSNLLNNLHLTKTDSVSDYVCSDSKLEETKTITTEGNISAANYVTKISKLSNLGITSGSFTLFKDGEKHTIYVEQDDTIAKLAVKIQNEGFIFSTKILTNGIAEIAAQDGGNVSIGTTTDTSNIQALLGLHEVNGVVTSSRAIYQVHGNSTITDSDLFRRGNITEGTFKIGDEEIEITNDTTLNSLIAQINSSQKTLATAYWDSAKGELVLKSRISGSSLINIEKGTSNFTDILGFTDNSKLNIQAQKQGSNAEFTINGTDFTSTSNTITSDISRIEGVTINLKNISAGETVTVNIERDKEVAANAVEDIVNSYNELIENIDAEISQGGKLKDQTTLKFIRNQIRSLMMNSFNGNNTFRNLSAIGISSEAASAGNIKTGNINKLTFNKDKFTDAFNTSPQGLKTLLVGTENSSGIFTQVENVVESALKTSGYFESAERSYNTKISRLDNKIARQNEIVERYRTRLEKKFKSMDLLISKMQQQYSSFLG